MKNGVLKTTVLKNGQSVQDNNTMNITNEKIWRIIYVISK